MPTKKPFSEEQKVEAYTLGVWLPGCVAKVYDHGCDVVIGTLGCYYVIFENMREVRDGQIV